MKNTVRFIWIVGLMLLLAGCISQKPLTPEQIDTYWQLAVPPTINANAPGKRLAGKLPAHWIIHRNDSLIRSTISIVRAMDRLEAGTDSIEFSISPEYAQSVKGTLADMRHTLESLSELAVSEKSADRKKWSKTLADALITLESSLRTATMEEHSADAAQNDPTALAAQPLLEMISLYLNERTGESLLAELKPQELHQLRTVLVHLTLRIGFNLAGRSVPESLRADVLSQLQQGLDPQEQRQQLEKLLFRSVEQAPVAAADDQLRALIHSVLRWSPKAIKVLESFLDQWNCVDFIECSIDTVDNKSMITADLHILAKREIRMAQVMPFQPNLVFYGDSRIIIPPENPMTGEISVLFEPLGQGGTDLRFENPVYALVRWLILPLDNARLREVRVQSASSDPSTRLTSVTVLLEAIHDQKDPRRMIVFQDTQHIRTVRHLLSVQTRTLSSKKLFHYIRPDKRYSYEHESVSSSK